MSTWILILTLVAPGTTGGSAIASVPGFTSASACQAAGSHWLKNVPSLTWSRAFAVCVAP